MTRKIDNLLAIYNRFLEYKKNKNQSIIHNSSDFKLWLEQQYDLNNKLILLKFEKYLPAYVI